MRKVTAIFATLLVLYFLFSLGSVLADRLSLKNNIIRMHIIANSDDAEDQRIKMVIKDVLTDKLHALLQNCDNAEAAICIVKDNMCLLEEIANQTLRKEGSEQFAKVSLCKEPYGLREYDTFTLPSGVYQSLQVCIGNGEGQNWWCVVFPALCESVVMDDFEYVAADAGFSDALIESVSTDGAYEIRFWLLDFLGRIEIIFNNCVK